VPGFTDVVDADLSKYFDTIQHEELLRSVAARKTAVRARNSTVEFIGGCLGLASA